MFATHTTVILTTFLLVLAYAILIARRLNQSRYLRTTPFPSHEELLEASENWAAIDVLDDERIKHSTGKRYLVTGASGQLGSCMVELLARRGEQYIYCLDATPLPLNLQNRDGVHHIKTDIRSSEEVNAAIEKARPDVVFHFCVVIRFWERASFTYRLSAAVNVDGTRHVMSALQRLTQSEKIFLHCSSPAVLLPAPLMFRLGWNFTGSEASFMLSDDRPISNQLATHSYAATKAVADKLVRMANGEGGLKTGVVSTLKLLNYCDSPLHEHSFGLVWEFKVQRTLFLVIVGTAFGCHFVTFVDESITNSYASTSKSFHLSSHRS